MRRSNALFLVTALFTSVGCGSSNDTQVTGTGGTSSGGTSSGGASGMGGGETGGVAGSATGGGAGTAGASGSGGSGGATNHALKTVFIILMENHSWSTIQASKSAPYINDTLVQAGGHAEQYYTPKGLHPSEPNYIWLEAGTNFGITNDNDPSSNHQSSKDHLVTQLESAGISWKAYVEDIPGTSCPLTSSGLYGAKHTPQIYFDDVTNTNDPNSQNCIQHVRPFGELATDLANDSVARYNFISPNLCHDMHGETLGVQCNALTANLIKIGDDWLAQTVPTITNSKAYNDGGVLFVVWDEGDEKLLQTASDGPIGMLVLSPLAKVGYQNSIQYTHSSTLRTVEEIFDVPFLADANNATDLSDFFTAFP
jgi:hypothetical protein